MDDQGKRVSWVELYLGLVFVLVATFQLARLRPELSPYGYVWLLTGWMVMCAALSTRVLHGDAEGDLERYLGPSRAAGSPAPPSRSRPDP
jgi:hypothetical protein